MSSCTTDVTHFPKERAPMLQMPLAKTIPTAFVTLITQHNQERGGKTSPLQCTVILFLWEMIGCIGLARPSHSAAKHADMCAL